MPATQKATSLVRQGAGLGAETVQNLGASGAVVGECSHSVTWKRGGFGIYVLKAGKRGGGPRCSVCSWMCATERPAVLPADPPRPERPSRAQNHEPEGREGITPLLEHHRSGSWALTL